MLYYIIGGLSFILGMFVTFIYFDRKYDRKSVGTFVIDTTGREGTLVYAKFIEDPEKYICQKQITFDVESL